MYTDTERRLSPIRGEATQPPSAPSCDPEGVVFDIKRSCLHDGPGIRTTVFLKGCPLDCLWCHNPESKEGRTEIAWRSEKCALCGACVEACPLGHHSICEETHSFDREGCVRCGRCVEACVFGALSQLGTAMTVPEVMFEVLKDRKFYTRTGGGLTLSGGEPFAQPIFALALLDAARRNGIHTCLETCGHVIPEYMLKAAQAADLLLYDLKETDTNRHREFTGVGNEQILQNLKSLDELGANIILRCPIIPGFNDRPDHFEAVSRIASELKNLIEIHLMPFNPYAAHKATHIGRTYPLEGHKAPNDADKQAWCDALHVQCPVRLS